MHPNIFLKPGISEKVMPVIIMMKSTKDCCQILPVLEHFLDWMNNFFPHGGIMNIFYTQKKISAPWKTARQRSILVREASLNSPHTKENEHIG